MQLTMKDVMTANCQISNEAMLTSNHCAALARELNAMLAAAPDAVGDPEVVAVIGETGHASPETDVIHRPGIDSLPVGTELVDRAHVTRLQAEIDRLRAELGVTTDLLSRLRGMIDCTPENDAIKSSVWISTQHPTIQRIDDLLSASTEVQS